MLGPVGCTSEHSESVNLRKGDKLELSVSGKGNRKVSVVLETPDAMANSFGKPHRYHHIDYPANVDGAYQLTIERKDLLRSGHPCANYMAEIEYEYVIYRPGTK